MVLIVNVEQEVQITCDFEVLYLGLVVGPKVSTHNSSHKRS